MPQQEKRFTAHHIDAQFERYVQTEFPESDTTKSSNTVNGYVVKDLQILYSEQIQQEQQSLDRMRQRLSLAVASRQQKRQQETQDGISALHEVIKLPERRVPVRLIRPQRPWLKTLERGLVALLVMAIVAGWVALSHWPHATSGSQGGFDDASASPLGEPVSTIQGNFNSVYEWSSDSRTFVFLQVDTQKNEIDIHMLNVASGHTTIYPVLDPSWIPALNAYNPAYNPFQILQGRYLLAVRAQGEKQATMVLWDIIGQRMITTQIIPTSIAGGGLQQAGFVASHNEQKLAIYFSNGTVTIWDVASGQKLITCAGKILLSSPVPPNIQWYNHDQDLLFSYVGINGNSHLDACEIDKGNNLFSLDASEQTYSLLSISPNNEYIAMPLASLRVTNNSSGRSLSYIPDLIEILDAHTGKVLHIRHLDKSSQVATECAWLPDSQRLLLEDMPASSSTSTASSPSYSMRLSIWNIFTDQTTFVGSSSQVAFVRITPDDRYIILGPPDGRSMDIWQTSNSQKVARITTPETHYTAGSFFYTNNQQIVIGQKGNFDIWDIATGKLLYKYHGSTPFSIPGVTGSIVFWSPDGKYLTMMAGKSISMSDGVLSIWRLP